MKRGHGPDVAEIPFGPAATPCLVGEGLLGDVANRVGPYVKPGRAFIVTDEHVAPLYGGDVGRALAAPVLTLPSGEANKGWNSCERIIRFLAENGVERRDVVVAVGGGVITDLAGFAAAVALRGIAWIAVPTTLVGMVDAAIGGKTGIDLDIGKNLVGAFWPPRVVLADPLALTTLDRRQIAAGLAEIVKAAIIATPSLDRVLDAHLPRLVEGDAFDAVDLLAAAIRVKAEVVTLDEREAGERQALNLGHTLGHALEGATGYARLLHGEAVAWGMLFALRLARDRGQLATTEAQSWATRLQGLAPLPDISDLEWSDLIPFIARDKKRHGGRIGWVLPRLGGVQLDVEFPASELERAFGDLRALSSAGPFTALF